MALFVPPWRNAFSFLLVGWLLIGSAWAGDREGLFWEVEGKQGKAWLLGSIHFADKSFYPMRAEIEQAFEQARYLVVEVDVEALPEEQLKKALLQKSQYPNDETVRDHVSPKTLKQLEDRFRRVGVPLEAVERQKPAFLAMTLMSLKLMQLGYDPDQGIDQYFLNKAYSRGKPVREIETLEGQLDLLDNLGSDELVAQQAVVGFDETEAFMSETIQAWKRGDANALAQVVIEEPLQQNPEFSGIYHKLFFARNPLMASAVDSCIKEGKRCFVVVGAGHLVGEKSVVEYLRDMGYKVTQH